MSIGPHWEELLQSVSGFILANTTDTDPGVLGVSKDQKNCEKSKIIQNFD